jgi:hypothetical protein
MEETASVELLSSRRIRATMPHVHRAYYWSQQQKNGGWCDLRGPTICNATERTRAKARGATAH